MQVFTPIHNDPEPSLQTIEVSSSFQIPSFQIVGLPSQEVNEARERVRSAIEASGLEFPRRRVIVNLSPAHIRKRGTGADLAIAWAILQHSDAGKKQEKSVCAVGELGLSGEIKPVGQMTRAVFACFEFKVERLILSSDDAPAALEARRLIQKSGRFPGASLEIVAVKTLSEAWKQPHTPSDWLSKMTREKQNSNLEAETFSTRIPPALARSLLVAAAGGHHLLLIGPKGTGKSTAADLLVELLPKPSAEDFLESLLTRELMSRANSPLFDMQEEVPVVRVPASVRPSALIGKFSNDLYQPGLFALADRGILLADELPEWARDSRESLREPLERNKILIHRVRGQIQAPARFLLVATANLCPCGNHSPAESSGRCRCRPNERSRYLSRLSGPVLDRIDLVSLVDSSSQQSHSSWPLLREIREKALFARNLALARNGAVSGSLPKSQVEKLAAQASSRYPDFFSNCSLRGRHKLVRVALTLALLESLETIEERHLFEASLFRPERWLVAED